MTYFIFINAFYFPQIPAKFPCIQFIIRKGNYYKKIKAVWIVNVKEKIEKTSARKSGFPNRDGWCQMSGSCQEGSFNYIPQIQIPRNVYGCVSGRWLLCTTNQALSFPVHFPNKADHDFWGNTHDYPPALLKTQIPPQLILLLFACLFVRIEPTPTHTQTGK